MGNSITYLNSDNDIGDIAKGRWKVMRRLLVVFLDYVNASMTEPWPPGHLRNVADHEGMTLRPAGGDARAPPPTGPFMMNGILDDLSDDIDEIVIVDAAELWRLFAWASFLEQRDGSFELFAPLVETLRDRTSGLERYVTRP